MWLIWKWIGLGIILAAYFFLVYWQRKHWLNGWTEISILAITMILFDCLATWFGQRPIYWQGAPWLPLPITSSFSLFSVIPFSTINEVNPLGLLLLSWHPMAFALASVFYLAVFTFLIRIFYRCRWWGRFLAIASAITLILAHSYYAFEWLYDYYFPIINKLLGINLEDISCAFLPFILVSLFVALLLIKKRKHSP